ncbi:hypothetical protein V2K62_25490 [Pseudomonas alliivorans]|nr:hypothetical protein [Pseudomonas alliivorans]MEE4755222.1 hypothetical protein [Pseudomonas alliivorans]MEE4821132.1 hypothetical protein [Pseudomonas alliivorans]MEE4836281.1 hypothetical protein [Pseudomonas alliivorans]MEE4887069.1 hypothetical protein [Pseudomonas alliivorans]
MFESITFTKVLAKFLLSVSFIFYAPVKTAVLLIRGENSLDADSCLWCLMPVGLTFIASGYPLEVNTVHSAYHHRTCSGQSWSND